MSEQLQEIDEYLKVKLSETVLHSSIKEGELCLHVAPSHIQSVVKRLRDDGQCQFNCLIDICGVDYPEETPRFEVVYHLLSIKHNLRIRLKVKVDEQSSVPSLVSVFPAANWFEREAYDLYGIYFTDHPDLRRILTDYGFKGYPLRKDFPLTGHVEVRYDDEKKRVVYEPVQLRQEYRSFDFESPWEGADYILPGDEKAEGVGGD